MKWVLVDFSYLTYRAHITHKITNWSFYKKTSVGIIADFFPHLKKICEDPNVESNKLVIMCDSDKSFRKEKYSFYKDNRNKDPNKIKKQIKKQQKILKGILSDIGIQVCEQNGLEADDLLAKASLSLGEKQSVIITGDTDLYQMISNTTSFYDPVSKKYLDRILFEKKYKTQPAVWASAKTISGDRSDNINGVPGVGIRTAIKYLNNKLPESYKAYKSIQNNMDMVFRNRDLMGLPHPKTQEFCLFAPSYNPNKFFRHCEKYNFKHILGKKSQWINFFNWKRIRTRKRRLNGQGPSV